MRKHYSWQAHASTYMERTADLPGRYKPIPSEQPVTRVRYRDRAIFTDLDQNLVGNPTALKRFIRNLVKILEGPAGVMPPHQGKVPELPYNGTAGCHREIL